MIYECHITCEGVGKLPASYIPEGWSYSVIDGDPDLGRGQREYLTAHFDTEAEAVREIRRIDMLLRDSRDVKVLRRKIEKIIYDHRTP